MTLFILLIFVLSILLIAFEPIAKMNKAAVAMFAGVCCWLFYIADGATYVIEHHPIDFLTFIASNDISFLSVKQFIARHVFFSYLLSCANVVLFLLATTSIVEVLNNNGCFDFLAEWLRTWRPLRLLWLLAGITFLISAQLDNLATVVLLLTIVHPLLQRPDVRRIYCTVIVLSANCGGAISAIGDMTTLKLWTDGWVTPTAYFLHLVLPVSAALVTILFLLYHRLPRRLSFTFAAPYRGDDTLLTRPQRLLLLLVGVGGLWFIPTFSRITQLPACLGALCVLSLLWIVNELCNRSLLGSDRMVGKRLPMALQYANLQNLLFFIGVSLMVGALVEAGLTQKLSAIASSTFVNPFFLAPILSLVSAFCGNVVTLITSVGIFSSPYAISFSDAYAVDGLFWYILSYSTILGGSFIATGTVAGFLLLRMEGVSALWYIRHITPKVIAGFFVGLAVMMASHYCF